MVAGTTVFSIGKNVSLQRLGNGEGAVLLDVKSGQLHTCNDTTVAFLSALDGNRTFDMVVAELVETFDVAEDVLRKDLSNLAQELVREGLIT